MLAVAPLPQVILPKSGINEDISENPNPFWLEVLSRGHTFIPEKSIIDISNWDNEKIRKSAHKSLRLALTQNRQIVRKEIESNDKNMNIVITNNKVTQYLIEKIKGRYVCFEKFPPVTFREDPSRGRLFFDLASFILIHVIHMVNNPNFDKFDDFDITLLKSSVGYSNESVKIQLTAIEIAPEQYKKTMVVNLGCAYNNLGLAINFLGDTVTAHKHYCKALELSPGNTDVRRNIKAIEQKANYIGRKIKLNSLSF